MEILRSLQTPYLEGKRARTLSPGATTTRNKSNIERSLAPRLGQRTERISQKNERDKECGGVAHQTHIPAPAIRPFHMEDSK